MARVLVFSTDETLDRKKNKDLVLANRKKVSAKLCFTSFDRNAKTSFSAFCGQAIVANFKREKLAPILKLAARRLSSFVTSYSRQSEFRINEKNGCCAKNWQ